MTVPTAPRSVTAARNPTKGVTLTLDRPVVERRLGDHRLPDLPRDHERVRDIPARGRERDELRRHGDDRGRPLLLPAVGGQRRRRGPALEPGERDRPVARRPERSTRRRGRIDPPARPGAPAVLYDGPVQPHPGRARADDLPPARDPQPAPAHFGPAAVRDPAGRRDDDPAGRPDVPRARSLITGRTTPGPAGPTARPVPPVRFVVDPRPAPIRGPFVEPPPDRRTRRPGPIRRGEAAGGAGVRHRPLRGAQRRIRRQAAGGRTNRQGRRVARRAGPAPARDGPRRRSTCAASGSSSSAVGPGSRSGISITGSVRTRPGSTSSSDVPGRR